MARDFDIWVHADDSPPPADEARFETFEKAHGVRLPESFKALYCVQNGGCFHDLPDCLLPLGQTAEPDFEHISPVGWQCRASGMEVDDLDWVEEEFGDLNRMYTLLSNGHYYLALDYNRTNSAGEPQLLWIDFECIHAEVTAPSFTAWLNQLTASDDECAVDWDEHKQHPILFQETIVATWEDENKTQDEVEYVLCRDGEQGLLVFKRTRRNGRLKEVERASLPKGVRNPELDLDLQEFRPDPNRTFTLTLEPVDSDDIQSMTCKHTKDGTWKNCSSSGVAVIESTSESTLRELAATIRETGLAHAMPEPDLSDFPSDLRAAIEHSEQITRDILEQQKQGEVADPSKLVELLKSFLDRHSDATDKSSDK
jgi:hypothetical protein